MIFSFDESEIMNNYLDQEVEPLSKENFIQKLNYTKGHTEDPELIEICSNIILKINGLNEERYNKLILNLPVDTISLY